MTLLSDPRGPNVNTNFCQIVHNRRISKLQEIISKNFKIQKLFKIIDNEKIHRMNKFTNLIYNINELFQKFRVFMNMN